MPCYNPLVGVRGEVNANGKRPLLFSSSDLENAAITHSVPCGNCVGCRLDRSRDWAIRCMDEAKMHRDNCFITLTYNKDNLPLGGTLNVKDWQDFAKRLRKSMGHFRYFHAGEYGSKENRPHYHALLFGINFEDRKPIYSGTSGGRIYSSESLSKVWKKGYCSVGELTFESASYVARYCLKKVNGPNQNFVDPETGLTVYDRVDENGEVHRVKPEYTTMSRRPGIGKPWYDKYKLDIYPSDFRIIGSMKLKPPRFYDSQLEKDNPAVFEDIKRRRIYAATNSLEDNTPARLAVKEFCAQDKVNKKLKRRDINDI